MKQGGFWLGRGFDRGWGGSVLPSSLFARLFNTQELQYSTSKQFLINYTSTSSSLNFGTIIVNYFLIRPELIQSRFECVSKFCMHSVIRQTVIHTTGSCEYCTSCETPIVPAVYARNLHNVWLYLNSSIPVWFGCGVGVVWSHQWWAVINYFLVNYVIKLFLSS